jgi:hypothetical protein
MQYPEHLENRANVTNETGSEQRDDTAASGLPSHAGEVAPMLRSYHRKICLTRSHLDRSRSHIQQLPP